jgi:hypothetical protein|nr:MAG TPA: baseplate protein [Caudoviricetes sp.]
MDSLNIVTSMRGLINEQIAEVHTALPVRVTAVNYGSKTVTLESLVTNKRGTEDEIDYPTFYEVPFAINGGGTARISFPLKAGDIGTVIFSERDPSNALQTTGEDTSTSTLIQPCGLYPICFIPKIATAADTTDPVDPDKIVISNNKNTYAEFDPTDTISIYNSQGMKIEITGSNITITDGTGTISMSGGTVNINGLKISPNGTLTLADGSVVDKHTHGGVESGGSSTAPLGG